MLGPAYFPPWVISEHSPLLTSCGAAVAVGFAVDAAVGFAVGATVGFAVGATVGFAVGAAVGFAVGVSGMSPI